MQRAASLLLCCLCFDVLACGQPEQFQRAQPRRALLGQGRALAFGQRQESVPKAKFIGYILSKCGETIHSSYQRLFRLRGRE